MSHTMYPGLITITDYQVDANWNGYNYIKLLEYFIGKTNRAQLFDVCKLSLDGTLFHTRWMDR